MAFESLLRRPASVALAGVALTLLSAYCLGVVDAGYALQPPQLGEAFARGSFLGVPPAWFAARMAGFAALTGILSALAVGGDPAALGAFSSTALRRLLVVHAPLLLTPWSLAQDDIGRRPSFAAFFVGLSVALAIRLRPDTTASDAPADAPADASADASAEPPATRAKRISAGLRAHWPVLTAMALHAIIFTGLTVQRDRALWSATIDLGIFKEALWHTLHGRVMYSPTVGYSFFGEHFTPIMFLLAPLYALWPTSACLLTVQSVAVSLSAWPLYRLARELGLSRALATALPAAMIFSPPMQTALHYDFHMDLLAVPCLSWLVLALHRRQWLWSYVALVLLVSVKEDMFIPASAAILSRVFTGDRVDARRLIPAGLAATAYCFLAMFVIIRAFGPPPGAPVYMGGTNTGHGGYKFLRNFRHLSGWGGPMRMLLGQPVRFALYALTDSRLTTLLSLLMPLGFLSLRAGRRLILMAPLGIILLSDNPEIVQLRYHYSAIQHPGVFFAAAFGAAAWVRASERPARDAGHHGDGDRRRRGAPRDAPRQRVGAHPRDRPPRPHGAHRRGRQARRADPSDGDGERDDLRGPEALESPLEQRVSAWGAARRRGAHRPPAPRVAPRARHARRDHPRTHAPGVERRRVGRRRAPHAPSRRHVAQPRGDARPLRPPTLRGRRDRVDRVPQLRRA
ncbi:MAG: DUF2079 domain-containing protein [Polyangiales bacterium]